MCATNNIICDLEIIQVKVCNMILNANTITLNNAIILKLGRLPIYFLCKKIILIFKDS